ncbi:hypothetical protein FHS89_001028 [Rubricella aquisinus]|uniref:Uncharacterized protein n=1 Tax=Rubricella aquisinus TaxID=2028108 RepID=A0A840WIS5_9RHOB|nr:hypothetical protein [Rubricella aquisinus]MBB5515018.1 hypothetical protein [Rubricella aquisinus]
MPDSQRQERPIRRIATVAAVVWSVLIGILGAAMIAIGPAGPLELTVLTLALVLPLFMIFMAVFFVEEMRGNAAALKELSDRLRAAPVQQGGTAELAETLRTLSERQKITDRALYKLLEGRQEDRTILSRVAETTEKVASTRPERPRMRPATPVLSEDSAQRNLPLVGAAPTAPEEPRDWDILLTALNFPNDERDQAGFRALRRAGRDHQIAELLRASEDVLNLLSQDGIYVDDLDPLRTDAALWRRFAEGERGATLAGLAGIDDTSAITLTKARMRSDPVMRDAALHFMRRFDTVLKLVAAEGVDAMLDRLADSRTGRCFMLLGSVTGSFE